MIVKKMTMLKRSKILVMFTLFTSIFLTSQILISTVPSEWTSASIKEDFPSPISQAILFEDDFERATLGSDWSHVGSGSYGINTDTSQSPTRSAYHYADAGYLQTRVIDLSSYQGANVSYWVRQGDTSIGSENPDTNEDLFVEYYRSTGGWSILDQFDGAEAGGTIYTRAHNLPANAIHSGFRLRFRQEGGSGSSYDWWHFDDVKIMNTTAGGPAPGTNPFMNLYYNFIGINEVYVGSTEYIEFVNYGQDRDMTGWYVKAWVNGIHTLTYNFPNGWIHQQDRYVPLRATSGSDSSSTLYIGSGVFWDYYNDIAIGLFDDTGANVDWFETEYSYVRAPDAQWDRTSDYEIDFSSSRYYAYRDHKCDLDSSKDWTMSSYGSQGVMNPGQSVEDWYLYKVSPSTSEYYNDEDIGIDDYFIEFKWTSLNADFGAVEYTLQISDSNDFTNIIFEKNNITEGKKFTSITIDNIFSSGYYYWRVRPVYQAYTGAWSSTYNFESTKSNPIIIIIILIIVFGIIGSVVVAAMVVKKKQTTTARNSKPMSKRIYRPAAYMRYNTPSKTPASGTKPPVQNTVSKPSFLKQSDVQKTVIPVKKTASDSIMCNRCGAENEPRFRFCTKCGYPIKSTAPKVETKAIAQPLPIVKHKPVPKVLPPVAPRKPIDKFPMPKIDPEKEPVKKPKRGDVLLRQAKVLKDKYFSTENIESKVPELISKSSLDEWISESTTIDTKFEPEIKFDKPIKLKPLNKNSLFPSITSAKSTTIENSPSVFQSEYQLGDSNLLNKESLFPSSTSPELTNLKLMPSVFNSKSQLSNSNLLYKKSLFTSTTTQKFSTLSLKPSVYKSKSKLSESNLLEKKYKSIYRPPKTDDGIPITELTICIKCGTHNRNSDKNCNECRQELAAIS